MYIVDVGSGIGGLFMPCGQMHSNKHNNNSRNTTGTPTGHYLHSENAHHEIVFQQQSSTNH